MTSGHRQGQLHVYIFTPRVLTHIQSLVTEPLKKLCPVSNNPPSRFGIRLFITVFYNSWPLNNILIRLSIVRKFPTLFL